MWVGIRCLTMRRFDELVEFEGEIEVIVMIMSIYPRQYDGMARYRYVEG